MNKLLVSAGFTAASMASVYAVNLTGLTEQQRTKPWSVSASVRAFYDDNYNTANKNSVDINGESLKRDSFGFEVTPGFFLALPGEQTTLAASYYYTMRFFEDRPENRFDHQHEFDLKLDHKFSPRYSLNFEDSFVYSQEPEIIDQATSTQIRNDSDVFRNLARLNLAAQVTELLTMELSFQSTWYDYLQDAADIGGAPGSLSAVLDRFEHLIKLESLWQLRENTKGVLGYRFGITDYTSDELINATDTGDIRDNSSHTFYAGVEHQFASRLNAALIGGIDYIDYSNLNTDDLTPYVTLVTTYEYLPESTVRVGVRYERLATDLVGSTGNVTTDQQAAIAYGSVSHKITPKLTGTLIGQIQHGEFQNGDFDGDVDIYYTFGVGLRYRFNPFWSADLSYGYDRLDSDQDNRSFTRNRVFAGVRADY